MGYKEPQCPRHPFPRCLSVQSMEMGIWYFGGPIINTKLVDRHVQCPRRVQFGSFIWNSCRIPSTVVKRGMKSCVEVGDQLENSLYLAGSSYFPEIYRRLVSHVK